MPRISETAKKRRDNLKAGVDLYANAPKVSRMSQSAANLSSRIEAEKSAEGDVQRGFLLKKKKKASGY